MIQPLRESAAPAATTEPHWEPKYPFDLVLAYEDMATRDAAMRLHGQLARQLQTDFDLRAAWWKLRHLAEGELREQATDDVTQADMVILSVHAASDLPDLASSWIEDWALRPDHHKCALVALVLGAGNRPEETRQLLARLQRVARQARMDFFTHVEGEQRGASLPDSCRPEERLSGGRAFLSP